MQVIWFVVGVAICLHLMVSESRKKIQHTTLYHIESEIA